MHYRQDIACRKLLSSKPNRAASSQPQVCTSNYRQNLLQTMMYMGIDVCKSSTKPPEVTVSKHQAAATAGLRTAGQKKKEEQGENITLLQWPYLWERAM